MPTVLVDTGVWYSFFDPKDRVHDRDTVDALANMLEGASVIVPWPVTYETLRTRLTRRRDAMIAFERQIKSPRTVLLDDSRYRDEALEACFEASRLGRPLSLVDALLRSLIADPELNFQFFATYNDRDFADVCARRSIEMIPGTS